MRTPKLFSSKFVKLIKAWNEEEIKSFELWLRSPWCNSNKNLIRLMDRMKKYHPDFNDSKVTKEKLFAKILPNGKYSDRRMNNILSEAYLAAEKFMVFQRFEKEQSLQKDLLTQEFQSRYLDDWFFRDIQKEIDRLEKKEVKDWEDHLDLFRMYRRVYHHPDANMRMSEVGKNVFNKMSEEIKIIYLLEKAINISESLSRNRMLKDQSYLVGKEKRSWLEVSENVKNDSIELYRLRFIESEDPVIKFFKIKEQYLSSCNNLNSREDKIHLLSLLNDCLILIKKGQLEISESLPLYKLGLERRSLLSNGILSRTTFTAIVTTSNSIGDFRFTKKFINNYVNKLEEDVQDDCYYWALGHTAYWEGNLEDCLEILQKRDFKVNYFQLITKVLRTQAYFDIALIDSSYESYLFNFFDTFEKWLNREKVWSVSVKKSFLSFVQIARAMAKQYFEIEFNRRKVEDLFSKERSIQALNWLTIRKEKIILLRESGKKKIKDSI